MSPTDSATPPSASESRALATHGSLADTRPEAARSDVPADKGRCATQCSLSLAQQRGYASFARLPGLAAGAKDARSFLLDSSARLIQRDGLATKQGVEVRGRLRDHRGFLARVRSLTAAVGRV